MSFWKGFEKQAAKLPFKGLARPTVRPTPPVPAQATLDYKALRKEMMKKQTPPRPAATAAAPAQAPGYQERAKAIAGRVTDPFTWRRALALPVGK